MKTIITSIFTLFITTYTFSQDKLPLSQQQEFLINSTIKLKPSQIISDFKKDMYWISDKYKGEKPRPTSFESAYNLNVFDFFELTNTYDTDLKKEFFRKTDDYKHLLDSLKGIKTELLNSVYYSHDIYITYMGLRENYDVNKRVFFIAIGEVIPYRCDKTTLPKVIGHVEFKQLSIHKKYNLVNHGQTKNSYTQYLFIPMDATTALEVENNRADIKFLITFDIKGIYTAKFNDEDFMKDRLLTFEKKECQVEVVRGNNLRLIMYNEASDKIYYDKIFRAI